MKRGAPLIERLLDRVVMIPIAGCWIFTGAVNDFGYGIIGLGARGAGNDRAHRITYRHFCGEIPDGMFVCHRCDQPACCNPHHLFLGTAKDNTRDCMQKGRASAPPENRHIVGEVHYGHVLTEEIVREARRLRGTGMMFKDIASALGFKQHTIYKACSGLSWRHVA